VDRYSYEQHGKLHNAIAEASDLLRSSPAGDCAAEQIERSPFGQHLTSVVLKWCVEAVIRACCRCNGNIRIGVLSVFRPEC
jgi:hypothetical protein